MTRQIIITTTILSLFLGTTILNYFGYLHTMPHGSFIDRIHPSTYTIIIGGFLFLITKKKIEIKTHQKINLLMMAYIIFLIFYLIIEGRANALAFIVDTLLCPVLLSLFIYQKDIKLKKIILKVVVSFLICNSLLAITERIFYINLFPTVYQFSGFFRSTAFQGHPLNNALITAVLMSFVIISEIKSINKIYLLILGFSGLICFGARGALIISTITLAAYMLYSFFFLSKKKFSLTNVIILVFVSISGIFFYYIIFETSFGERIIAATEEGSSEEVRINTLAILSFVKTDFLLWGSPEKHVSNAMHSANVEIIENFWILWILKFGVIFTSILIILFLMFLLNILRPLSLPKRIFLITVFLGIASTNNSLGVSTTAMTIFIICSYCFIGKDMINKKLSHLIESN